MKIKTNLVFLGFVRRILFMDRRGGINTHVWKMTEKLPRKTDKKSAGLFCTGDAKTLYIIPWDKPRISKAPGGFQLQKKTFEKWANQKASQAVKLHFPDNIKNLAHVGNILEIEYTSDKFERAGDDGKYNLYFHPYKKPGPIIYVNCPMRPYIWGINDTKNRKLVTYRGLVL